MQVKCPFCTDDPSEHMGISLGGFGWSCWRNPDHKGRSTPRLIAALVRCSAAEAEKLAGGDLPLPTDDSLLAGLRARLGTDYAPVAARPNPILPREFKPLGNGSPFAAPFILYLRERGYRKSTRDWLIANYHLHYATSGKFAYRIIIPIYDRWGELQTWTGRSIVASETMRYRTLPAEQQLCSPKETLIGLPTLWAAPNPKVLLVCEGPFDAFWITAFGRSLGVYGTCLFGLSLSDPQAELLVDLQRRFSRVAVLLDAAASFQAFKLSNSGLGLGVVRLAPEVKDPATLDAGAVVDMCLGLVA